MKKIFKIICSTLTIYIFVIFSGAYLTLKCEQQNNQANIITYQDALWWSLNATSIGDSNVYPITVSRKNCRYIFNYYWIWFIYCKCWNY